MGKIPAYVAELHKAFIKHHKVSMLDETNQSYYLLRFYAIECGLKYAYLRTNRLRGTSDIQDEELSKDGHNLSLWAKKLRIPASICKINKELQFNLGGNRSNERWPMSAAHQAWRYGIGIDSQDEKGILEQLNRIKAWIDGAI
jgi:hypothetical protein